MSYTIKKHGKDLKIDDKLVEAMYWGIANAETGSFVGKTTTPYGRWIRAVNADPSKGGSMAFGPLQINFNKAKDLLRLDSYYNLTAAEKDFIENDYLPLLNNFAMHGGNKDPNYTDASGQHMIPSSVWQKHARLKNWNSSKAGVDIPYNPVYDYIGKGGTGVGDNVLLEFYGQDAGKVAVFKEMYEAIGKKAIAGEYFKENLLAKQWGYKSHTDTDLAAEIGTVVMNWRWGANMQYNDRTVWDSSLKKNVHIQGFKNKMKNSSMKNDWLRYKVKAFSTIRDHLDQSDYMDTTTKDYKFEHDVLEKASGKKYGGRDYYIPQIYYEETDKSGKKKKIYVGVEEALYDVIFNEIDFNRG